MRTSKPARTKMVRVGVRTAKSELSSRITSGNPTSIIPILMTMLKKPLKVSCYGFRTPCAVCAERVNNRDWLDAGLNVITVLRVLVGLFPFPKCPLVCWKDYSKQVHAIARVNNASNQPPSHQSKRSRLHLKIRGYASRSFEIPGLVVQYSWTARHMFIVIAFDTVSQKLLSVN